MNISVVIPLYNKEKHIQRAIKSVLNQSIQNLEIIIVDDGSTDSSFESASAISDPRIRIIQQENKGVSAARNKGIEASNYDFIAFLDADDEWLPDYLEKIVNLIKRFPNCGAYATSYYIMQADNRISIARNNTSWPLYTEGILDDFFKSALYSLPFFTSSIVVEKKTLINIGGFPVGVRVTEDTDTWMRIALFSKIAYAYRPLSIYHQEAENRYTKNATVEELFVVKNSKMLLHENSYPELMRTSIYEFIVRHEIRRARTLLLHGDNISARNVLAYCKDTVFFEIAYFRLDRWCSLPKFISKVLIAFYYRFKQGYESIGHYLGLQ